jgi:N-acetylmuramoyl-L-alanine amidase
VWQHGTRAIGIEDPVFAALLRALHATMTWRPGEREIFVTTAEPEVISFAIGDTRYSAGRVESEAGFAPFLRGTEAYVPLDPLLAALSLRQVEEQKGRLHVLEPQLTALDVSNAGGKTVVAAFAGMQLQPRIVQQTPAQITYEFDGVGSTLTGARTIGEGIQNVTVRTQGRPPAQDTFVVVTLNASASPTPAAAGGAQVTGVDVAPSASDFTVAVAVSGDATYDWHRLQAPDDRFWIDIEGAHLAVPPRQDVWTGGNVTGVRVMQFSATSVRVALSLSARESIDVIPSATGVRVVVGDEIVASAPEGGNGSIGENVVAHVESPGPAVDAVAIAPTSTPAAGWKFGPRLGYVPTNPRLIVIDPGHGGSDPGTVYRGVEEKTIALDTALRLRDILVADGWQVRMTRTTDRDVFKPDDSARDELQARDDIANAAGARMFVSIHVNACCGTVDPTPSGTTSYYSKPEDVPLAQDVESAIASAAGTKDDGIVKSHLYVTLHAFMPAVLIETAFLTNPGDFARLTSPQWRQRLAQAIADGIETYASENPVTTPPPSANQ